MSFRSSAVVGSLLFALSAIAAQAAVTPVLDGDADGVSDDRDGCPYTPRGITVGPDGCSTPGDEDEDGIPDTADACPLSPAGARVDDQGCALDEDVDGVADGVDRCPRSPLGALVKANGCAPGQIPGPAIARAVPRTVAAPPSAAAPTPTLDPVSARPGRPAPPVEAVNATVPAAAQPMTASPAESERTFYFDEGESTLSWSATRAVRKNARVLVRELERDSAAVLLLSGHGDIKSDGMAAGRLASARVFAVRDALVANGIPAERISVRVPGINEPRFSGADLARNCRVELRVQGQQAFVAATPAASVASGAAVKAVVPAPTPPVSPVVSPRALAGTAQVSLKFAPYSAILDVPTMKALGEFAQGATRPLLADGTTGVLIVSGIAADEIGVAAQRLAESRAASVRAYLVSLGIPRKRIEVSAQSQTAARRADLSIVAP